MSSPNLDRLRKELAGLASESADFIEFAAAATDALARVVPFDRSCWHTVDPATVLFTASVNRDIECSGTWLAEHEYAIDDVNQWWRLARSGELVGRSSKATGGDLKRSARHRSVEAIGIADEMRASFVANGTYWGAAAFLRDADAPWFTDAEEAVVRQVLDVLAFACRRSLVSRKPAIPEGLVTDGLGLILLDGDGRVEVATSGAERWFDELVESPPPRSVGESKIVQLLAAQARTRGVDGDPLLAPSRARVRTRSGVWIVIYATAIADPAGARTAVVIQPAMPGDVAPLVALAYELTPRETDVARLCLQGRTTKEMAAHLGVTAYTVQDHLKSIFDKTHTRTRNELVSRVFLSHYVTRWEPVRESPAGWLAQGAPEVVNKDGAAARSG